MLWVCNTLDSQDRVKIAICKTDSLEQAKRMTNIPFESLHWSAFTEQQVKALIDADEGFLVQVM